jgi:hypothetical protein
VTRALLIVALAAVALSGAVRDSGADFVRTSGSLGNTFAAAADFNTVAVSLTDPGTPLRGVVALQATASSERGIDRVRFQTSPAGAGTWTNACEDTTAPYGCTWDTAGVADGSRDVRALAVDQAGYQRASTVAARSFDNTAPSVSVVAPSGPLHGTVTYSMTAADGSGTGVTGVTLELRPSGGAWSAVCTDNAAPYQCAGVNTALLADGLYEARATATDGAGFSTTSAVVTNIRIDNTAPSTATLTDPAATLSGNVALSGTAADAGSGVAAWIAQYSVAGANAWTDGCSDIVTPFTTCTWATAGLTDGPYDLRALVRDAVGLQTASAVRANKVVDNDTTPTGADIQTANGGTTIGKAEPNDTITLTYSEVINPTTITAGFTGASMPMRVTFAHSGSGDRMDFTTTAGARLNLVNSATGLSLAGTTYVTGAVIFNATMVQSGTAIVITLGTIVSGGANIGTHATNSTMTWVPSATAQDWAAHAVGTATVTETTGTGADREF